MNIVGYSGFSHDPAVSLLSDGEIKFALESEKITRHKQEITAFPEYALRYMLKKTGFSLADVDYFAVNFNAGFFANKGYLPFIYEMLKQGNLDWGIILNAIAISASHHPQLLKQLHEYNIPPIVRVRHHLAHLASSFPYSSFDEAAVAVFDAAGELDCTSTYYCSGRHIKKLDSMNLPTNSLGSVYMMCTRHLGYKMLGDEYKVMGLASYGSPHKAFEDFFKELIILLPNGRYKVNPKIAGRIFLNGWKFPKKVSERLDAKRDLNSDEFNDMHKSFAFELQKRIEEAIVHVTRHLKKVTNSKNLCMAGGVALNSVANGKVLQESGFENIFIPPAAHDAGTSLGAATYVNYYKLGGRRPEPMRHAYWGPSFENEYIERELVRCRQAYSHVENPSKTAAERIASGDVIGWFQGASEFGPRALGNRSILGDPRQSEMKGRVNKLVKEREGYRPFAPSMLCEYADQYLNSLRDAPFMLFVDSVQPRMKEHAPAVVHVDGTARVQTVTKEVSPLFYSLIEHFKEITGVPIVLNTSFNVAGEPIVNTPVDAIRCFNACGLDALIIGKFMLQKQV